MSADLHDALRAQGLVPPAEDVHFVACSVDYRQKLNEAGNGLVDAAEHDEMSEALEESQAERRSLRREKDAADRELTRSEGRVEFLENQVRELRSENTLLTQKLLESESVEA